MVVAWPLNNPGATRIMRWRPKSRKAWFTGEQTLSDAIEKINDVDDDTRQIDPGEVDQEDKNAHQSVVRMNHS